MADDNGADEVEVVPRVSEVDSTGNTAPLGLDRSRWRTQTAQQQRTAQTDDHRAAKRARAEQPPLPVGRHVVAGGGGESAFGEDAPLRISGAPAAVHTPSATEEKEEGGRAGGGGGVSNGNDLCVPCLVAEDEEEDGGVGGDGGAKSGGSANDDGGLRAARVAEESKRTTGRRVTPFRENVQGHLAKPLRGRRPSRWRSRLP